MHKVPCGGLGVGYQRLQSVGESRGMVAEMDEAVGRTRMGAIVPAATARAWSFFLRLLCSWLAVLGICVGAGMSGLEDAGWDRVHCVEAVLGRGGCGPSTSGIGLGRFTIEVSLWNCSQNWSTAFHFSRNVLSEVGKVGVHLVYMV